MTTQGKSRTTAENYCTGGDGRRHLASLCDHAAPPPRPRLAGPVRDRKVPPLMSVTEVAEALLMTRRDVQYMISTGRLPAVQVGNAWVIRKAEVEKRTGERVLPNPNEACAAHDDAHLGQRCPDLTP